MSFYGISRAYRVLKLSKSVFYYVCQTKDDSEIEDLLKVHAESKPDEGFWKIYHGLRKQEFVYNHKRVHRDHKSLGVGY